MYIYFTKIFIMVISQNQLPHQLHTINDGVMGGRSTSQIQVTSEGTHFSGEVSLANNGGFASMRGQWTLHEVSKQPEKSHQIQLTFKGDGKRYQFRLFTADNSDGSAYVFNFETKPGETITMTAPLSAFSTSFRGRSIQKPPLKLANILEYGLLIGDKQEGTFSLWLKGLKLLEK